MNSQYPSKHDTLNQCWLNVGPASKMMAQQSTTIGSTSHVCLDGWQTKFTYIVSLIIRFGCKLVRFVERRTTLGGESIKTHRQDSYDFILYSIYPIYLICVFSSFHPQVLSCVLQFFESAIFRADSQLTLTSPGCQFRSDQHSSWLNALLSLAPVAPRSRGVWYDSNIRYLEKAQ